MTAVRFRRAVVPACLLLIAALVVPACAPPPSLPRVIVYGDSLGVEAAPALRDRLAAVAPGYELVLRVAGGTAPCDWHAGMKEDVALRPSLVVLAFTGNRFTDCSRRGPVWDRYRGDTWWSIGHWQGRGASTLVVAPPGPVGTTPSEHEAALGALSAARETGSPSVDLAPWFTDPVDGRFAERVPCLAGEGETHGCVGRSIQVRAGHTSHGYDTVHLCGGACGRYSSGVARFADVVASSIARHLGVAVPDPLPPARG